MPCRRIEGVHLQQARQVGHGAVQSEGGELRHLPRHAQSQGRGENLPEMPPRSPRRRSAYAAGREVAMKRPKTFMAMVSEYTALAFLLPVSTFVGYAIGYMLDKAFGTHFLYLVFLLIGIA